MSDNKGEMSIVQWNFDRGFYYIPKAKNVLIPKTTPKV